MDGSTRAGMSSNRRRRRRRNTRGGGSGASGTEDTDNSVPQQPEAPLNGIEEMMESSGRGTGSGSSTAGGDAMINCAWKDGKGGNIVEWMSVDDALRIAIGLSLVLAHIYFVRREFES